MRYRITIIAVGLLIIGFVGRSALDAQLEKPDGLEKRIVNTVREAGSLESESVVDVRTAVSGTVITLVPEMSTVKGGDVLVVLDSSKLHDDLQEQTIHVARAQAAVEQTAAQLQAVQSQTKLETSAHELDLKIANLALEGWAGKDGESAHQRASIDSELRVAHARLSAASEELKVRQAVANVGDAPKRGLADSRLAVLEAEAEIESGARRKRMLETHSQQQRTAELELKRLLAEKDLISAKFQQALQRNVAEAELNARRIKVQVEESRLDQIRQRIKACEIRAPRGGVVVYANAAVRRTVVSEIEEGASVRERQSLLQIIDLTKLRLKVMVHESRIARVKVGQSAVIRFDAFPNKTFRGTVKYLSPSPEPTSWFNGNIKEYAVQVTLDQPDASLKLGLTAVVEIETGR
ncbi:MAG: efflux RND transporter periplasmic adaptor subunit [Planctomycetota bacterium]|nr:efflux RND transporter periplasmic adaptor subunit [Planctomycetota bacterium]